MNNEFQLGMTILNSDMKFTTKRIKAIFNHLLVITQTNEIIVFSKHDDMTNNISYFKKKYIILNSVQNREEIIDIFGLDGANIISPFINKYLIVITKSLIVYYYYLQDGLCINKINLSVLADSNLLHVSSLYNRFLVLIFSKKIFLFDTFTNTALKEEPLQVLIKEEVDMVIEENLKDFKERQLMNRERNNKKEDENQGKDKVLNFEAVKVYQIKENSFFLWTTKNETYFLVVEKDVKFGKNDIDYELIKIRIMKESFDIKKFINDDSLSCLINDKGYLFHNSEMTLKISFLDLVEELSEITSYDTKAKFPIIYLGKLLISKKDSASNNVHNEENLIVIYKDLTVELFDYDTKIKELISKQKFTLMVEDQYLEMNYITTDNAIIGYTNTMIQIFDLRRINKNNEKYVDKMINLNNIFENQNKKIFSEILLKNLIEGVLEKILLELQLA